MNPLNRGLLVAGIGLLTLQMAATDTYLHFLRPSMRPYLLAAAALFIVLGVVVCVVAWRSRDRSDEDSADHEHHHASWVPWLLLLPIVIGVLAPDALDAYASSRATPYNQRAFPLERFDVQKYIQTQTMAGGVPELPLSDYIGAALRRSDRRALETHDIRLLGFVAPAGISGTRHFLLTRYRISCCAADATPMQVDIHVPRSARIPAQDHWVEATVRLHPTTHGLVQADATTLKPVSQPAKPYDYN